MWDSYEAKKALQFFANLAQQVSIPGKENRCYFPGHFPGHFCYVQLVLLVLLFAPRSAKHGRNQVKPSVVVTYPTKTTNPRKQTKTLLKKHEKIPPRVSQSFEEKTTTSQKKSQKIICACFTYCRPNINFIWFFGFPQVMKKSQQTSKNAKNV